MDPKLTALIIFYFVLLVLLLFCLIRWGWPAKKRLIALDLEKSQQELSRQRLAHELARRLALDHQAILGVSENATQEEIDQAWRRRIEMVQPEGDGLLSFWLVLNAYETLSHRKQSIGNYYRYLDAYLCAWLSISNQWQNTCVRWHGVLSIWAAPLFFVGGPYLVYCLLAGRGQPHVQYNWAYAILLSGLLVLAPCIPRAHQARVRFQDWYCRWRASRQAAAWGWPHSAEEEFPSERLHQLAWKSKSLDQLGVNIAQYRYGIWLAILFIMAVGIVLEWAFRSLTVAAFARMRAFPSGAVPAFLRMRLQIPCKGINGERLHDLFSRRACPARWNENKME